MKTYGVVNLYVHALFMFVILQLRKEFRRVGGQDLVGKRKIPVPAKTRSWPHGP